MWAALRSRTFSLPSSSSYYSSSSAIQQWKLGFNRGLSSLNNNNICKGGQGEAGGLLNLEEVEKILSDVRADDVKVVPVKNTSFADFVVVATGRSAWHVRNIAQALIYKVKQKQRGAKRTLMPSVEGQAGGKWIVVDCGSLIIHALDEKMRAYFNLEALWTKEESTTEDSQDVEMGLVKVRRKNNSKNDLLKVLNTIGVQCAKSLSQLKHRTSLGFRFLRNDNYVPSNVHKYYLPK